MTPEQILKLKPGKTVPDESQEQKALFCWAATAMHGPGMGALRWMYANPNSAMRGNKVAAAQMVAEGVRSGVADIFLPASGHWFMPGVYPNFKRMFQDCKGLYIELKRQDGLSSDFSQDQLDFAFHVLNEGYMWAPAFGYEHARHLVHAYLQGFAFSWTSRQLTVYEKVFAKRS